MGAVIPPHPVRCAAAGRVLCGAAAALLLLAHPALAGTPTLTTITLDGSFGDWTAVLADADNVVLDGPAGSLPDLDAPSSAVLDLDTVAYTWDATNLYFYIHRRATSSGASYYWFFIDRNNDGRMQQGEPLLQVKWTGNSRNTTLRLDTYNALDKVNGDAISNAGVYDGYTMPGRNTNGTSVGNVNGGSASGLIAEVFVPWAGLGVAAGSALRFHVSSTSTLAAIPTAVADNLGRSTAYAGVTFDPNRAATTTPGTVAVFPATIVNTGNVTDVFDLTWTSSGSFTPASVTFYRDSDASGTLTPADTVLTDTDGDAKPDTGAVAGLGSSVAVLVAIATPAGGSVGASASVVSRATSSIDTTVFDTATDGVTLGGPQLTLLKAVDKSAAAPGDTITYTISYTNTGNLDALNVVVIDPVPAASAYVAGSASGAGTTVTWSHDGGATYDALQTAPVTHVKWTRAASLPAAGSGSVSFQVTVR